MMTTRAAFAACLLLFWATPAWAEVADKEAGISDIWVYAAIGVALTLIVGVWRLWAGSIFWVASILAAYGPVAEWRDPFVGPSIEREISQDYGLHACGALALTVLLPLVLFLWQRRKQRRQDLTPESLAFRCESH